MSARYICRPRRRLFMFIRQLSPAAVWAVTRFILMGVMPGGAALMAGTAADTAITMAVIMGHITGAAGSPYWGDDPVSLVTTIE